MSEDVTVEKERGGRYSYGNLPPSLADARARLDEVEITLARIEADLESTEIKEASDSDAYANWKFDATRAKYHYAREQRFLQDWINNIEKQVSYTRKQTSAYNKGAVLDGYTNGFLKTATKYAPRYTTQLWPPDRRTADERRSELVDLKLEYQEFFSFLKSESIAMSCPINFFYKAKSPISRIMMNIEKEVTLLNQAIRKFSITDEARVPKPSGNARLGEIGLAVSALKRELGMNSTEIAVWLYDTINKHGVVLSLDEAEAVRYENIVLYLELTKERLRIERIGEKP